MIKIYGSMLCPDCVQCREDLDKAGVSYEYLDFSENLRHLKEFLAIRESCQLFDDVRKNGSIGIPCIVDQRGNVFLSWDQYVTQAKA